MPSVSALLSLARWRNALIAAGGVLVGAWWARGEMGVAVLWCMLAAIGVTAAANAWNDIADVEIDRVVHPTRPLVRGALTRRQAAWFAGVAALAGAAAAWTARPALGILTLIVLPMARVYSSHLKPTGLPGNAVAAMLASLPFLYGGWAVGAPAAGAMLAGIAVPLHFAREVAKDLDDVAGDAASRQTIPVRYGPKRARLVVAAAALVFLVVLAWPAARAPLFALALIPAVALSLAGAGAAVRGARGGPALFKAAMVCAMLAVIAARP